MTARIGADEGEGLTATRVVLLALAAQEWLTTRFT